ncbi:MAG: phosphodiester glycosidase family protein [Pseudomonadota bacterium]
MKRLCVIAPLLVASAVLAGCGEQKAGEPVVSVSLKGEDGEERVPVAADSAAPASDLSGLPSACSPASFEGVALTHCVADPDAHTISAAYGSGDGSVPYGDLKTLSRSVDASTIAFAMNGGTFSDDLTPRGYLVTDGNRLAELDRGSGDGNFYLKPNGVFFGTGRAWRVLSTDRFFSTVRDRPQFGTQSGPMLLIDGELSDAISENGNSRAVRNGVGIDEGGKAHFVISNAPISYGQLARFLRDEAKATDALFLDANSSSLWNPVSGRMDDGRTGPILVVSKKGE